MIGVALKGLLGRKLRGALTAFAIVLGVAMISGSFVLTDTVAKSFDGIFGQSYEAADAVISSKEATSDEQTGGKAPSFSADVLRDVQELPGVAKAQGSTEDDARLVDADGNEIGRGGIAFGVDDSDQSLSPLQLESGDWPEGANQIAIDGATADGEKITVGDTIGAYGNGPVQEYEVTGIVRFGTVDSLGGATIAVFDLATAQALFDKKDRLDTIRLGAEPGVSPTALVRQVGPVLPDTARVKTATAQAASDSEQTQDSLGFLRNFLLAFAGVALFVGSKVIANTFSITVSQRIRELATLRTLGASRRQVLRSVILEAGVIGLLASVVGLFTGVALAKGLYVGLGALGVELPSTGLVVATRTVVVSVLVGTLIALFASLRPALRATRIQPIAAVREGAVLPPSRFARFGTAGAVLVVVAAAGLLAYGVLATSAGTAARLITFGLGAVLLFRAVTMVSPRLVKPLASILGAPGARLGGSAGELARQNAIRNPSRTAATAGALMIGLSVITFVAVLGQGAKAAFSASVDELFVADYAVVGEGAPVPSKTAQAAAAIPGVQLVSEIRSSEAKLGKESVGVNGVDENMSQVVDATWSSGSGDVAARLGRDGAFVKKAYAEDNALTLGSPLTLKTPTGAVLRVHVIGIFDEPKGGSPFGDISISLATFDRAFVTRGNDYTLLNVEGDPSDAMTTKLEQGLAAFPNAEVQTRDEFKSAQIKGFTQVLNIVFALLGLSVIVSLFGIVNTLVLSVFERTRELGMLRAIGMTRRQVRRMIRYESVITALIGATFGIGLGMTLAFLVTEMLSDNGLTFAVPFESLAVFVGVAIVAGMLAAILPARRAARLNVLHALQYE
jgi:putative ABC transport system permease protein